MFDAFSLSYYWNVWTVYWTASQYLFSLINLQSVALLQNYNPTNTSSIFMPIYLLIFKIRYQKVLAPKQWLKPWSVRLIAQLSYQGLGCKQEPFKIWVKALFSILKKRGFKMMRRNDIYDLIVRLDHKKEKELVKAYSKAGNTVSCLYDEFVI